MCLKTIIICILIIQKIRANYIIKLKYRNSWEELAFSYTFRTSNFKVIFKTIITSYYNEEQRKLALVRKVTIS